MKTAFQASAPSNRTASRTGKPAKKPEAAKKASEIPVQTARSHKRLNRLLALVSHATALANRWVDDYYGADCIDDSLYGDVTGLAYNLELGSSLIEGQIFSPAQL